MSGEKTNKLKKGNERKEKIFLKIEYENENSILGVIVKMKNGRMLAGCVICSVSVVASIWLYVEQLCGNKGAASCQQYLLYSRKRWASRAYAFAVALLVSFAVVAPSPDN